MAPELIDLLSDGGAKRQIVGQPELVPCLAARVIWRDRFANRPVLHFLTTKPPSLLSPKGAAPLAISLADSENVGV